MRGLTRALAWTAALTIAGSTGALGQSWGPRTLQELKQEIVHRASGEGWRGIRPEDAKRGAVRLKSLDRDHWASVWSEIGEEYMARAAEAGRSSPEQARDYYRYAWRLFNTARWPTEKHSEGKWHAYERGLEAFQQYGQLIDPPIETVRIPFEGKELVMYLRLPEGVRPAPLVFGINGLDSRKEDVIAGSDRYIEHGIAASAIDMPGTGQAPVLIDVGSERMFSAALDYLETRPDIDSSRIVVQGRSWSGYWAAVLAYTERERIRGAVVHGVGIHHYFQPEWQRTAVNTPEYLFDLFPARAVVYGVDTMEEFLAYGPRLSLIERGLIDQPSAPMLLINGERDTQQPISDLYLLMKRGDPKLAWVNPVGNHMGDSEEYPSSWISENVILPWVMQRLEVAPAAKGH